MGEAKTRKQIDPNYGRRKRGLVVSNPIMIDGTILRAKSSNLDPQELRFALLFWDELAWPSSRAIHFANGPEEDFLQKAGILTRPEFSVDGDVAQGIAQTQIQAFEHLNSKEPNKWTLAQGENSLLLEGGLLTPDKGAMLDLHRAIPVPDVDVPLDDILSFKTKRSDELVALRSEIDNFFAAIENSSQFESELSKHVHNIDVACAEAIKVTKEWQIPFRLASTKVSFEFRPLVTAAAGLCAFEAATHVGLALTTSLLAGLAGAGTATLPALKVSQDYGWRGLRPRANPYRYVAHYHRELF